MVPRLLTPVHFYHVYAVNGCFSVIAEHLQALRRARLGGGIKLGVVGTKQRVREVYRLVDGVVGCELVAQAAEGFEHVTLDYLHDWVADQPDDVPVLYCHTKGVSDPSPWNDQWRRSMTTGVVTGWSGCVDALDSYYDAVGLYWLTPERYPDRVQIPYFGGNFWWARARYLKRLGSVGPDRHGAEAWLGSGPSPQVLDLCPGWPGPGNLLRGGR